MEVGIKKLHEDARIPTYGSEGAAAFDLYSVDPSYVLGPCEAAVFGTGLAFEIPEDHVMLIFSRSGHGFKQDIRLANCVGVIDSDYRGELKVKLTSDGSDRNMFVKGERIAQGMVLPVKQVKFLLKDELATTIRGDGGFGSTGKA